jgi:hypothetical protein
MNPSGPPLAADVSVQLGRQMGNRGKSDEQPETHGR